MNGTGGIKISVLTPTIRPEGLKIIKDCLCEQTFTDFEWLVDIGLGKKHDLNQAWNRMLRRAKGELVVFYEDYTKIDPEGLQRFWDAYTNSPKTFFTAAVGKSKNLDFISPKWDWRYLKYGEIGYDHCEMDWGAAPLAALKEIGGFDEELDNFWSMDNVSVCKRADMLGYSFMNIDNPAVAYDHDEHMPHPFRKDYKPVMSNLIMERYKENPNLGYI